MSNSHEQLLHQKDPLIILSNWYDEAKDLYTEKKCPYPFDAATLCSVGAQGQAHGRVILIKKIDTDKKRLIFYTNYNSPKSQQIERNNKVAIVFHWGLMGRQVRIEGNASKISTQESDEYFASRPRLSRLGAWASDQSSQLASQQDLYSKIDNLKQQYKDDQIPRPDHWGGFQIQAQQIEFWLDGEFRLHERFQYIKDKSNSWTSSRLSP